MSELFNGIKFAGVGSYDSGSTEMIRGSKTPTKDFNDNDNDDVLDVAESLGGDYLAEHVHHYNDGHSRGHTHTHTHEGGHTHTNTNTDTRDTPRIGVGAVCQIEGIPCVDGYSCINGRCAVPAIPHNSGSSTIGPGGVCQIGGILCVSGHSCIDGRCVIPGAIPQNTGTIGPGGVCQIGGILCVDGHTCINGRCVIPDESRSSHSSSTHTHEHRSGGCSETPTGTCLVNCNCFNNDCAMCTTNCQCFGKCCLLPRCGHGCLCNGLSCTAEELGRDGDDVPQWI